MQKAVVQLFHFHDPWSNWKKQVVWCNDRPVDNRRKTLQHPVQQAQYVASDWQLNYRPEALYFPHNYTEKHVTKIVTKLPRVSKKEEVFFFRIKLGSFYWISTVFGFHFPPADLTRTSGCQTGICSGNICLHLMNDFCSKSVNTEPQNLAPCSDSTTLQDQYCALPQKMTESHWNPPESQPILVRNYTKIMM